MTGQLPANAMVGGRYIILGKVGQGGMAAVYLVSDTHLVGKRCALKEMSDAAIVDPSQRQQAISLFQREAQLLTQFHHRHIPQVIDTFTEGGKHFIVMEYVDGATLEDLLKQRNGLPFPEAQVRAWLQQLCDVLHYLHSQNPVVVFRDLKPANIMIDRTGTVKLVDFGIARFFSPQKRHDTQTIGTAGYAAPEQYGQSQCDARADIYALGATLYRLLTGYDPAATPLALPPLEKFPVALSPGMSMVIKRALEHDRERRWQSVQEMAAHLGFGMGIHAPVPVASASPKGAAPVAVAASRPTTKLVMAMAQMSTGQLVLLGLALAVPFALGTWYLAPRLSLDAAMAMPLYLMAGPLAYAASKRRWAAGGAHLAVTGLVWLVASKYIDVGPDLWRWIVGLLLSAVLLEGVLQIRDRFWPVPATAPWWKDCAWLAVVAAVAGLVAIGIPSTGRHEWLKAWLPLSAAVVGAVGWFLGDLYRQNLQLRQSGLAQRGRKRTR